MYHTKTVNPTPLSTAHHMLSRDNPSTARTSHAMHLIRATMFFFFVGWFLCQPAAHAQVSISLNVDANPNPYIADWVNRSELAILTVTNTNPALEGQEYRIVVRVSLDGNTVVETNPSKVSSQRLPLGADVFLADEVIPYDALEFSGNYGNRVLQSGMLPAGMYSFCLNLVDMNNNIISTPREVCRPMNITSYQPPELIYPPANTRLTSTEMQGSLFTWSPVTPAPPADLGVKYLVVVSEVRPGQSPSQAFFANYPFIEEEVFGTTQMLWPPDADIPNDTTAYVWGVKALTFDDQPYHTQNAGFASFSAFTVVPSAPMIATRTVETPTEPVPKKQEGDEVIPKAGEEEDPDEEEEITPKAGEEEEEEEPVVLGMLAVNDTIYAGLNGEFEVIASNITGEEGAFSGQGSVYVDWLKARIEVTFDSIQVDPDRRLIEGKVVAVQHESAPVYPLEWGLEAVAGLPYTNQVANQVVNWIENTTGQTIPFNGLQEYTTPVKVPLGVVFPDGNELAITEIAFQSNKSEFNMIAAKTVPPGWGTDRLGFRAKDIRFHPTTIEMPPGRIELVEDITMGNVNNKIQLQFKAPTANNLGCYIEWNEDGFSEYGLELAALFTREWLIPSPDDDPEKKVSASLSVQVDDWNRLIFGGTLEKAEIVGARGMTILADSMYLDLSFDVNPPGMIFPANFPGDTIETFRGFYMKNLEVEMPEGWKTFDDNAPKIAVQNVIINHTGLTMKALATSVLQFPNAKVADLVASIDTVHVEMVANTLTEGGIKGRIGLPVSKKDSIQNPLQYTALFSNPQDSISAKSFQLTVEPTGPIEAHLLKGQLELSPNSNITLFVGEENSTFDIDLHGSFGWSNVTLGPVQNVNLGLQFQGLGFSYDSADEDNMGFQIGSWAFASEQKFMANFPVSIDNIGYNMLPKQQGQLLRGRVNFDVLFNLSEDISGMTQLGVEMALLDDTGGQKFFPQYNGTNLDSINIQANLAAVNIEGAIGLRSEDPVFGNGFVGSLQADFKAAGIQASALAEFGNTAYQNNNQLYRYWRVEADVVLPPPGVVFLPGLAFRGFGGGAYYNMEATLSGTSYSFSPLKSQLGFQARGVIATTPSEDGFNADVTLAGEFNQNTNGLTYVAFTGDFWVGAELSSQSREEAIVAGELGVTYNFPDKHFNMFANVSVDAPPLSTPSPVGLVLDINGLTNQWYFKFGEPANPNNVSILGANLYAYLMFGNTIPSPSGFTPAFSNAYHNAVGQYPGGGSIGSGGVGQHTNTGSGFATGLGFMFNHTTEFSLPCNICLGDFFAGFNLGAGAELHLAFLNYSGSCAGNNPIGINGWRANGGLGFYATAGAYVRREGGLGNKTWQIVDLAAGAWIYGEFPNPYYAAGAVSGHAYVFDVINVHFHKEFEVGTACTNDPSGTSVTVTPGDVAADQQDKLVQYIKPPNMFNYPTDAPLAVKYGLDPDEVFTVAEQQADGTIVMRTFKMEKSVSLQEEQQNGTWNPVMLNNTTNVLGEYLYTTIQQLGGIDGGFAPAAPVGDIGGGSSGAAGDGSAPPHLGPSGGAIFNLINMGGIQVSPGLIAPPGGGQTGGGPGTAPGLDMSKTPSLPYPPVPSPPNYGDLPPTPTPPVNNLKEDTNYTFTVTATLREYLNGNWTDALTKEGNPVTETVVKSFSTGPMQPITGTQLPAQSF